jgi:sterol desaturase/sphingolipid hydroxylase (fatty acid hydroxylase superfamily)
MTFPALLLSNLPTVGLILAAMAVVALVEAAVPLHARGRWHSVHLRPNITLTFITFATNAIFNAAVLLALATPPLNGFGLLHLFAVPPLVAVAVGVLVLDFSFYVAHVAMHGIPILWRCHRVHHSDPAVDVTTTVRQHPGEGVVRYAVMAAAAIAFGASPGAFAVYRAWSALNGLLEHANIRVPRRLDGCLSLVVVTPNMHKVHHSRTATETETNFGNIFALFDRLFSTFTPSERGLHVVFGLDGLDAPATQTTVGLLALPFRGAHTVAGSAVSAADVPLFAEHWR